MVKAKVKYDDEWFDFIIKEHDPSTIKLIGRLAALDSPKEQLEEIRK